MPDPIASSFLVPFDASFRIADLSTRPPADAPGKKRCREQMEEIIKEMRKLQRLLFADGRYALLLIFQAMDAGGKDGTIRAVMTGINPAGCQVFSFGRPSTEDLDHDFLWRTACRLPERGRIGIFNRSYYEEVLVVRVHPELLGAQKLPEHPNLDTLWEERFASIRDHELHLARNGTVIVKFWLNISREEQRLRFLSRIDQPKKNWKFTAADIRDRNHWDGYQRAYEEALRATSRPWAPWYAIPADDKPFMRLSVAKIIAERLQSLPLAYPVRGEEGAEELMGMRRLLEEEG